MIKAIGMWILKIFLGGVFNKVVTRIEDKAEMTKQAAILHAEGTVKASETEVAIVKKQVEVERVYKEKEKVKPADDPFGVDEWNKG